MVHLCKLVIDVADHVAVEGSVIVVVYTTGLLLNACMPCCLAYFSFGGSTHGGIHAEFILLTILSRVGFRFSAISYNGQD